MAESVTDAERPGVVDNEEPRPKRPGPPPAPIVAAALSGFVVGVLLTLVASGLALRPGGSAATPPTAAPPVSVSDSVLRHRIAQIVSRQLGPMPSDPRKSRLSGVSLMPAELSDVPPEPATRTTPYRTVYIVFRLNNNPFGSAWRLKSARADVFTVMKALYTSRLPIYDVTMAGRYPLPSPKGKSALRRAVLVSLDHRTASSIPWRHWSRGHEQQLWNMLAFKWVDPRFA
jgi:hypothetical protein